MRIKSKNLIDRHSVTNITILTRPDTCPFENMIFFFQIRNNQR